MIFIKKIELLTKYGYFNNNLNFDNNDDNNYKNYQIDDKDDNLFISDENISNNNIKVNNKCFSCSPSSFKKIDNKNDLNHVNNSNNNVDYEKEENEEKNDNNKKNYIYEKRNLLFKLF